MSNNRMIQSERQRETRWEECAGPRGPAGRHETRASVSGVLRAEAGEWAGKGCKAILMRSFQTQQKTKLRVQEAEQTPDGASGKKPTSRHLIVKVTETKDKGRILKPEKENGHLTGRKKQLEGSGFFSRNQAGRESGSSTFKR